MKYAQVLHRRDVIRGARDRWLDAYKSYQDNAPLGWRPDKTAGQVRAELAALDLDTCSPADIDRVIGTTGWAENKCDECGRDMPTLLQLGELPDYESRWWSLCLRCLNRASKLLAKAKPH